MDTNFDSTVLFFFLLVALVSAISVGFGIFYGYRAITFGQNPPHRAPLVSTIGSFPAWYILNIVLTIYIDFVKMLAVNYFNANGWLFAGFSALVLCIFQYAILDYFYRKS